GFSDAMERQRAEARKAWAGSGEAATEAIWFALRDKVGASEFLGYDTERAEGVVRALVSDGKETASLKAGESGQMILNQTPFYGESGGQVGDSGTVEGEGVSARVTDTQKRAGDVWVHEVTVEEGELKVGEALILQVDHARRSKVRANHSATHLLHQALREVLGTHVAQKGSLVAPDRLRFDFSHTKPVSGEESAEIERRANAAILDNSEVVTRLMGVDEAIEMGAMALFGEKYGDEVRVVSMGPVGGEHGANRPWSIELCGGTHVGRTGDIGLVAIVGEGSVSSGVRRLEALTGAAAREYLAGQDQKLKRIAGALKAPVDDVEGRVEALVEERRRLERELADARRKLALSGGGEAAKDADEVREVKGIRFLPRVLHGVEPKDLRGIADDAKQRIGSGVVAILAVNDGKASLVVGVTDDLKDKVSAVDLVRAGAEAVGGKGGGGRPDMAQAGGPDGAKAQDAVEAIAAAIG
ncbi:MAG: alanine--tRNA ligase-related protein, partial [Flavobacteriaceae bacterium]